MYFEREVLNMKEKSGSWILILGIGVACMGALLAAIIMKKCKKRKYICKGQMKTNKELTDEEMETYDEDVCSMNS